MCRRLQRLLPLMYRLQRLRQMFEFSTHLPRVQERPKMATDEQHRWRVRHINRHLHGFGRWLVLQPQRYFITTHSFPEVLSMT